MGFGGKGSSESNTTNDTKVTSNNNQVGASEGSLAFGANSSGNSVTTSDPTVVAKAADAIQNVAGLSIHEQGLTAREVTGNALDFGSQALTENSQIALATIDSAKRTNEQANDILSRSFEQYAGNLARNAGDAPQTVVQDAIKYVVYAVIGVAGLWAASKIFGKKTA